MTTDVDDRLRDFLADEGGRSTLAAPSFEEAVGRLAQRLAPRAQRTPRRLMVILAAALLTAAALGSAIGIGSGWLRLPLVIDTPSIPTNGDAVLEVGLHYYTREGGVQGIVARVPEPTRIHAGLPEGWASTGSGLTSEPDEPERALAISFWAVDGVSTAPCTDVGEGADPPMMRTLDGLAEAFTLWWTGGAPSEMWPAGPPPGQPRTTEPTSTTVSGFRARYLEVRIPGMVDTGECPSGYATWRNADGVVRRHGPDDVSRIWIVEVGPPDLVYGNGVPQTPSPLLVIDASSGGEPSPEALAELADIIDSLRIEPPRGEMP